MPTRVTAPRGWSRWMLAATKSFSARARATSARCPACKYPIVGTNPQLAPGSRQRAARTSAMCPVMFMCPLLIGRLVG